MWQTPFAEAMVSDERVGERGRERLTRERADRLPRADDGLPNLAPALVALVGAGGMAQRVERMLLLQRSMGNQFVLRQVANAPGPFDHCFDLFAEIRAFVEELKQRAQESLDDKWGLQWENWSEPKIARMPDGSMRNLGSVEGHKEQYEGKQRGLRNRISEWDDDDCNQSGKRITREDREWQFKPFPLPIPRPKPVDAPTSADAPGAAPGTRQSDTFSSERITEILIKVGVPAALVGGMVALIIAALADPEPFSKGALIIGSAAAVLFFVLLGQRELVPPDQLATADTDAAASGVPTETA